MLRNRIYYNIKPLIPRSIQILLRRSIIRRKRLTNGDIWPIDEEAGKLPHEWSGWPKGKRFALILTHDVESTKGLQNCKNLAQIEADKGFRASFNFLIEDYRVPAELRRYLTDEGFEIGIHGVNHNGKMVYSQKTLKKHAAIINKCLDEWSAVGFRAPSMLYNEDLIKELNIRYDLSTFDTDPFEPQPEGVKTIFPFWITNNSDSQGFVEMPYTLPQDFTLFILMMESNINIWKQKLDWIAQHGGMALMTTHPDYMKFSGSDLCIDEYPVQYYLEFLEYIKERYEGQYWHVLPKDMAQFWIGIKEESNESIGTTEKSYR